MIKQIVIASIILLFTNIGYSENNYIGYYKTIDDNSNEIKSIVKIYKTKDNTLEGKIIKIFPKKGESTNPVCDKCEGKLKNKPILGMRFMWGFRYEKERKKWIDGSILDPDNGKIYHCSLTLNKTGTQLEVYGYIKMIFKIGRKQVWIKTEKPEK
jgi:uncharacterized protein (DUF2147 family)